MSMEKTKGRPSEGVAGPPTKKSKGATDETEKLDEAEKPKGAMDNFVVQHQSTRKACEYLLAHAPVTQPVGYKHLRSAIDKAKEEIEGALDRNDFERAAKLEAAEVKMRNAAELEEVLLQKAIACKQYAANQYEYYRKNRHGNIHNIQYFSTVLKVADEYLERVPKVDLEVTVAGKFCACML